MRKLSAVLASTLLMTLMIVAPAGAHDRSQTSVSHARIVQEQSFPDAPDATTRNVGWSRLVRTSDGYSATVFARGLNPGGVYTFWWVSPYEFNADGTPVIPGEVFVARGASSVVGADGTARVRMQATTGQLGIVGLPCPWGAAVARDEGSSHIDRPHRDRVSRSSRRRGGRSRNMAV
jgi:hypothetical protein